MPAAVAGLVNRHHMPTPPPPSFVRPPPPPRPPSGNDGSGSKNFAETSLATKALEEEAFWEHKRMKYETLLDGGMAITIPATLCAAVAIDLICQLGLNHSPEEDSYYTTIFYLMLLTVVAIASLGNVAISMMMHFQAKLIFSSHELGSSQAQCTEFEKLWHEFAMPRRFSREGFIFSMPGFLLAMGFRPPLWQHPSSFTYASLCTVWFSAIFLWYWMYRIDRYWPSRAKYLRESEVDLPLETAPTTSSRDTE
eukprot:gnl/MRDRNA2_/MRDRNA2_139764_c0_seq1.p1 gnl/MRDRNA2_/MRDRNA2_139764_c0~~gnl/MRDRNA2_/MRDRNA2_139764_c0_seq1.p1  ORF type:complete len:252 (+),score=39.48 gnl/MRDRNA2_/MRDRNA2_139764_c0_seq1:95-850(+)